jgi:hypothetical protein
VLPMARLGSVVRHGTHQLCFICKDVIDPGQLERQVRSDSDKAGAALSGFCRIRHEHIRTWLCWAR